MNETPNSFFPAGTIGSMPPDPLKPMANRHLRTLIIKLFVGPFGIRAGWRLLIFLAIVIALIAGATFMAHATKRTASPLENEVVPFLIALFSGWVMSQIEHRRIADYGLPLRGSCGSRLGQGIVFGFLAMTMLLLSMRFAGVFSFGAIGLHGLEAWKDGAMWAVVFVFVGLFEEYFFRGYPLFTLATGIKFWPSAILLSAFFGFLHHSNPNESWVGAFEAGATGLLFCFMLRRTGDLWIPIGFHAGWDWAESYFYGVPDSGFPSQAHLLNPRISGPDWLTGGSTGPEGSWLSIALLVILWMICLVWLRGKRFPNPGAIRSS